MKTRAAHHIIMVVCLALLAGILFAPSVNQAQSEKATQSRNGGGKVSRAGVTVPFNPGLRDNKGHVIDRKSVV